MLIVGLTGGIGHGKTTFGAYLGECSEHAQNYESSLLISEVANDLRAQSAWHPGPTDIAAINDWLGPLPQILRQRTRKEATFGAIGFDEHDTLEHPDQFEKLFEYLGQMAAHPELQTQEITSDNKDFARPLLQWLGGYLAIKVDPGIWYDELIQRIHENSQIDTAIVGGLRYPADADRIRSADGFVLAIQRPELEEQDSQDLTERQRTAIKPDAIIYNDADLSALKACASRVYADLTSDRLVSEYWASHVAS